MIKIGDLVEMAWSWKQKARDVGVVVDISETNIFGDDKLCIGAATKGICFVE